MRATLSVAGIVVLTVLAAVLPFLPGRFDPSAMALSWMARTASMAAFTLVPAAVAWQIVARLPRDPIERSLATTTRTLLYFVVAAGALGAIGTSSVAIGVVVFLVGVTVVRRARLQPLPIAVAPVIVGLSLFALMPVCHDAARARVIDRAAPLVADIEAFHERTGAYPDSMLSVSEDYGTGTIGVERFHYERNGDGYNVSFELAALGWGAREIVMFNALDQHNASSHNSQRLHAPAGRAGGYFRSDDLGGHWRAFYFD